MSRRILVIDDDPLLRRLTARLLTAGGFQVATAGDGAEGLEILGRETFDAVICDLLMPGMSGFEVVRRIREDPRLADLPILVLTSQGHHEDRDRALEAGADTYMTKPFSSFELQEALQRLLDPSRGRAAS
jgi:chemosensory pili system protein ChpA (sensor histidine kinase/response regulator)